MLRDDLDAYQENLAVRDRTRSVSAITGHYQGEQLSGSIRSSPSGLGLERNLYDRLPETFACSKNKGRHQSYLRDHPVTVAAVAQKANS